MFKFIRKENLNIKDPGVKKEFDEAYSNRKFCLGNFKPIYNGKEGWTISYPGHEVRFILEEIRFTIEHFIHK